jgi:ferritin-like protein
MINERLRQSIEQLTKDTAAEWQKGYYAGVEACVWALEADAKLCDCAALEANECACGAWDDYKSITSDRAVEIVRALQEQSK